MLAQVSSLLLQYFMPNKVTRIFLHLDSNIWVSIPTHVSHGLFCKTREKVTNIPDSWLYGVYKGPNHPVDQTHDPCIKTVSVLCTYKILMWHTSITWYHVSLSCWHSSIYCCLCSLQSSQNRTELTILTRFVDAHIILHFFFYSYVFLNLLPWSCCSC